MIKAYHDRLEKSWTPEQVEEIEANHRDLIKMYHDDDFIRNAIDKHDANTLFNDAWDYVPRFNRLRAFCGGLATIFPNTTSVESDLLILKWEVDNIPYRPNAPVAGCNLRDEASRHPEAG